MYNNTIELDANILFASSLSDGSGTNRMVIENNGVLGTAATISSGGGSSNIYSQSVSFTADGSTYNFVVNTPNLSSFNVQYVTSPGDKLPPTQTSSTVILHYSWPPGAGTVIKVNIIGTL